MSCCYTVRGAELLVPAGTFGGDNSSGHSVGNSSSSAGSSVPIGIPPASLDSSTATMANPEDSFVLLGGDRVLRYAADAPAPAGWQWLPMRSVIREVPEALWTPAAKAMAFANWRASTRFCGVCGAPTRDKDDELARQCTVCGQLFFPRISPAILAVVRKDGKLLLARNTRSTTGFWSLIAGFVEPGETFEECVKREVMEEVGIEVEVDGYLGSQPWPFPDQLMLGFAARWKSGELKPDGDEIAEAGWFGPADHPPIPGPGSLSRRLIDTALTEMGRFKDQPASST
ncbi:MAG: NAD(+) diphosphatase [Spirochaetia bacterium]|nr:NAD(+) diphosphatase [Spirochaetia bacterium]